MTGHRPFKELTDAMATTSEHPGAAVLRQAAAAHYVSTYCIDAVRTADPQMHARCRLRCKNCDQPCLCPCHAVPEAVPQ